MNKPFKIDENSLRKLGYNIEDFKRDVEIVAKQSLSALGQRIISQAQSTLRRKQNVVTGLLINSGAVKEEQGLSVKAGFPTLYAYYVEFGRRAGKWPPFRYIYEWVRKRHFTVDDDEAQRIAYLIQRSIGKKGTKPHPFLKPAYEKNKKLLPTILKKAMQKVMQKDYTQ